MKIVIQRVQSASVVIEDCTVGAIKQGLLLLVGVGPEDTKEDLEYAVRKIVNMRIFDQHLRVLQSPTWLASSMTISTNPCQLMFL